MPGPKRLRSGRRRSKPQPIDGSLAGQVEPEAYTVYHRSLIENLTYQKDFRDWILARAFEQEFVNEGLPPLNDLPMVLVHEENLACCQREKFEETFDRVVVNVLLADDLVFGSRPRTVHNRV